MNKEEIINQYKDNEPIMTALTGEKILHEFSEGNVKYYVIRKDDVVDVVAAAYISVPVPDFALDRNHFEEDK